MPTEQCENIHILIYYIPSLYDERGRTNARNGVSNENNSTAPERIILYRVLLC